MSRGDTCFNCGGEGHFARDCPSGTHISIQKEKDREEIEKTEEIEVIEATISPDKSSAMSVEGSDIWPEIAKKATEHPEEIEIELQSAMSVEKWVTWLEIVLKAPKVQKVPSATIVESKDTLPKNVLKA